MTDLRANAWTRRRSMELSRDGRSPSAAPGRDGEEKSGATTSTGHLGPLDPSTARPLVACHAIFLSCFALICSQPCCAVLCVRESSLDPSRPRHVLLRLSALRTPNGNGDDLQSAQPVQRGRQRRRHPSRGEGGRQIQRLLRPLPNPPLSSTLAAAGCSRQRPEAGPAPGSRGREGRQGRRASRRR